MLMAIRKTKYCFSPVWNKSLLSYHLPKNKNGQWFAKFYQNFRKAIAGPNPPPLLEFLEMMDVILLPVDFLRIPGNDGNDSSASENSIEFLEMMEVILLWGREISDLCRFWGFSLFTKVAEKCSDRLKNVVP